MTVSELMSLLEDCDPDATVRIMMQESWPFENAIEGLTTRDELGYAYARLLTQAVHDGQTYNLHGHPLTQARLAQLLSETFGLSLAYRSMEVEAYRQDRIAELGDFLGTVIAGIYEGIRLGAYDRPSDFEAAAGRPHQGWAEIFASLKP